MKDPVNKQYYGCDAEPMFLKRQKKLSLVQVGNRTAKPATGTATQSKVFKKTKGKMGSISRINKQG